MKDKIKALIQKRDYKKLRSLLNSEKEINNLKFEDGTNILTSIAKDTYINEEVCKYITTIEGLDINQKDNNGENCLIVSAKYGNLKLFQYCIKAGANLLSKDKDGQSPLLLIVQYGHLDLFEWLLKNVDKETQLQIVKIKDKSHKHILHIASYENQIEIIQLILDLQVFDINEVDKYDWSSLMLACFAGHLEAVEVLLNQGRPDLSLVNNGGKNALQLALNNNYHKIAQLLLQYKKSNSDIASKSKELKNMDLSKETKSFLSGFNSSLLMNDSSLLLTQSSNELMDQSISTTIESIAVEPKREENKLVLYQKQNEECKALVLKPKASIRKEEELGNQLVKFDQTKIVEPQQIQSLPSSFTIQDKLNKESVLISSRSTLNAASSDNTVTKEFDDSGSSKYSTLRNKKYLPSSFSSNSTNIDQNEGKKGKSIFRKRGINELPRYLRSTKNQDGHHKTDNHENQVENDSLQKNWETVSKILTLLVSPVIKYKFKDNQKLQSAFREKLALCFIIFLISLAMGFLTFGFSNILCHKETSLYVDTIAQEFGANSKDGVQYSIVRGELYDVGSFFKFGFHRPIEPYQDSDLQPLIDNYLGQDISDFFPLNPKASGCTLWPQKYDPCARLGNDTKLHCHKSNLANQELSKIKLGKWVSYSWKNITSPLNEGDQFFVYSDSVFKVNSYLDSEDLYLGTEVTDLLRSFVGKDATRTFLKNKQLQKLLVCFNEQFLVGKLEGTSIGCFTSNLTLVLATIILILITFIKFIAATLFDWILANRLDKEKLELPTLNDYKPENSNVILFVTCYSECAKSLRTTLNSLAETEYPVKNKLLFVVADGDITGDGNTKSTPELLLDMMEPLDSYRNENGIEIPFDIQQKYYDSIGVDSEMPNRATAHVGHYSFGHFKVPFILVIKCGTPLEQKRGSKAGNRGKRDSQLIVMRFLSSILLNLKLSELEFDLFEKIMRLTSLSADKFDMILMIDADTNVAPNSVTKMVNAMELDCNIMGLCGETRIANKSQSITTMIQVYEYYISHHLGKAFESIFGGVTCLPGCFCMYRIKAPSNSRHQSYNIPILASPEIVNLYSCSDVSTLHKKNLLLLGEDRYLTTLMLRNFPKRKMVYLPNATCETVVPDKFSVLLSQRRRWINSTIHNLLELVLVSELCGIFCCSMQFVILLELIGTVVLPSALIFTFYLFISFFMGKDVLLPLLFLCSMFLLQALLIVITTRKLEYIKWMGVYILALPIWNFILPVYAFWHFDDFSWGTTRKLTNNDGSNPELGDSNDRDDEGLIVKKKWNEWKRMDKKMELNREKSVNKKLKMKRNIKDYDEHYQRTTLWKEKKTNLDILAKVQSDSWNKLEMKTNIITPNSSNIISDHSSANKGSGIFIPNEMRHSSGTPPVMPNFNYQTPPIEINTPNDYFDPSNYYQPEIYHDYSHQNNESINQQYLDTHLPEFQFTNQGVYQDQHPDVSMNYYEPQGEYYQTDHYPIHLSPPKPSYQQTQEHNYQLYNSSLNIQESVRLKKKRSIYGPRKLNANSQIPSNDVKSSLKGPRKLQSSADNIDSGFIDTPLSNNTTVKGPRNFNGFENVDLSNLELNRVKGPRSYMN